MFTCAILIEDPDDPPSRHNCKGHLKSDNQGSRADGGRIHQVVVTCKWWARGNPYLIGCGYISKRFVSITIPPPINLF